MYFFSSESFIILAWNPELHINAEAISSLPILGQFLDFDIKYWGIRLDQNSLLGIPFKINKYPFPRIFEFVNDFDVVVRQKVKFE